MKKYRGERATGCKAGSGRAHEVATIFRRRSGFVAHELRLSTRFARGRVPSMRLTPINSDHLDHCGRGYPRPQVRRNTWFSLNGEWRFAIDRTERWTSPGDVEWSG